MKYKLFIKDHLGSVRVEFEDDNGSALLKSQNSYYPFGCRHGGSWNLNTRNNHLYTGQERQGSFDLEYLRYKFRFGDPLVMGRFQSPDPLSEKFSYINPFNCSENEPVANIDLWGLQKVKFGSRAASNRTFMAAYNINRQTSGGKEFEAALTSQSEIDVLYTELSRGSGVTSGPFNSLEELKNEIGKRKYGLIQSTNKIMDELEGYFEDGKQLLIISVGCIGDDCSPENTRGTAFSLNHEEVAHGINRLRGESVSQDQEHRDYQGTGGVFSPGDNEIKNDSKFKDTKAKQQIDEIDEIIKRS